MTTAVHQGFLSREALGLRAPESISRSIAPQEGGSTVHYAGGDQNVSPLLSGHTRCINLWRGYQRYHMDSRGFVDIAYNGGFCQHGYVFAGRGLGIRSAANGTNSGNYRFYAWCWIGGAGETPTKLALQALAWLVFNARAAGSAGMRVVPHSFHKSTGCPGPLTDDAYALDNKVIDRPEEDDMRPYAQAVVVPTENFGGKNRDWDRALGAVVAEIYGLGLLETEDGRSFYSLTHNEDAEIEDWGEVIGAARYDVGTNPPAHRLAGSDRWDTAREVGEFIKAHPHEEWVRRGRPY